MDYSVSRISASALLFSQLLFILYDPSYDQTAEVVEDVIVMNPEIQKIQKKYAGKRDQASMLKQQEDADRL